MSLICDDKEDVYCFPEWNLSDSNQACKLETILEPLVSVHCRAGNIIRVQIMNNDHVHPLAHILWMQLMQNK